MTLHADVVMLSVDMLNVAVLSVVMLSVEAPPSDVGSGYTTFGRKAFCRQTFITSGPFVSYKLRAMKTL
jgi:hypothetical protein